MFEPVSELVFRSALNRRSEGGLEKCSRALTILASGEGMGYMVNDHTIQDLIVFISTTTTHTSLKWHRGEQETLIKERNSVVMITCNSVIQPTVSLAPVIPHSFVFTREGGKSVEVPLWMHESGFTPQ